MKANRLFIFLTVIVFSGVCLAGCDKNSENPGTYDIKISGGEPFITDEIDEVKCFVYLDGTEQEIAKNPYDPQGFTIKLPAVLPESYLVKVNESMPTTQIDDPQAKWQWVRFDCYKNGEDIPITLDPAIFYYDGTIIYVFVDRPVMMNGKYTEDPIECMLGSNKFEGSIEHIWESVKFRKGWNRIVLIKENEKIGLSSDSPPTYKADFHYSSYDPEYPIHWRYGNVFEEPYWLPRWRPDDN